MIQREKSLIDSNRENARRNAAGRLIKESSDITGTGDREALDAEIQRNQELNQQLAEQRAKIKGNQALGFPAPRVTASEGNNWLLGQRALVGRYRDLTQKLADPKSISVCAEPETGYKEAQVAFRVSRSGAIIDAEIGSSEVSIAFSEFTEIT